MEIGNGKIREEGNKEKMYLLIIMYTPFAENMALTRFDLDGSRNSGART